MVKWICIAAAVSVSPCSRVDLFHSDQLPPNFHPIVEGEAYRSGQPTAEELESVVERYGIKTVINLRGSNPSETWWIQERDTCVRRNIALVDIAMSSQALPSREDLLALYDTFLSAPRPVLIHCKAGSDRTGAAAAIWRMAIAGEPREQAKAELSFYYLHIAAATPRMDFLVDIFEPDRNWILNEYDPDRPDQPPANPF